MPTPNRGYEYPSTSDPALVPSDLEQALGQIDADVQTLFDGKADKGHTHAAGSITGLDSLVASEAGVAVDAAIDERELVSRAEVAALAVPDETAADAIASRLEFGVGDVTVGVAGDSTATNIWNWPGVFAHLVAARFPALRVEYHPWDSTDLGWGTPVVVQEGEGEPAFSGDVLLDTFTRTTNLETPDEGGPWTVLNAQNFQLDGSALHSTGSGRLLAETGARDMTSTTVIQMDTTATGAAQTLRIYHGSATGHSVAVQIMVSAAGAATVYLYRVVAGALDQVASQPLAAALGVPVSGPGGDLTVTIDGSIQNYTVTLGYGGQSWSRAFTITEESYAAMVGDFALFPQNATPGLRVQETSVSVADRPATYQALKVLSATMGGGTLDYQRTHWDEMFGREVIDPGTPPGERVVHVTDTFTRTGPLGGTTTDTGESWTAGTNWATDGSAAVASGTGAATVPAPGSKFVFEMSVVTTAPTAAQSLRLGARSRGDLTNGIFAALSLNTGGSATVTVYVRTPTGGYRQLSSSSPVGLAVNSGNAQALTVTMELDGSTLTVDAGAAGGTYSLTSAEMAELGDNLELQPASADTSGFRVLGIDATYTEDVPGTSPVYGPPLDALILAHGHNYGQRDGATYQGILDEFVEFVKEQRPSTKLLVSSQNPQYDPAGNPVGHAERQAAARLWARRHGYSYAPVFEHFHAQPDHGRAWVLPDGVHPTASPGGVPTDGKGSTEWARIVVGSILG